MMPVDSYEGIAIYGMTKNEKTFKTVLPVCSISRPKSKLSTSRWATGIDMRIDMSQLCERLIRKQTLDTAVRSFVQAFIVFFK